MWIHLILGLVWSQLSCGCPMEREVFSFRHVCSYEESSTTMSALKEINATWRDLSTDFGMPKFLHNRMGNTIYLQVFCKALHNQCKSSASSASTIMSGFDCSPLFLFHSQIFTKVPCLLVKWGCWVWSQIWSHPWTKAYQPLVSKGLISSFGINYTMFWNTSWQFEALALLSSKLLITELAASSSLKHIHGPWLDIPLRWVQWWSLRKWM